MNIFKVLQISKPFLGGEFPKTKILAENILLSATNYFALL